MPIRNLAHVHAAKSLQAVKPNQEILQDARKEIFSGHIGDVTQEEEAREEP